MRPYEELEQPEAIVDLSSVSHKRDREPALKATGHALKHLGHVALIVKEKWYEIIDPHFPRKGRSSSTDTPN
jgi:hypothetical protein